MSFFSKQIDKRIAAYQRELIETHYREVENMYRQIRGWRHDYRNHIQMMKVLAANGDMDALKVYLDELDTDLNTVDTVVKTGNPMVDAILNSKISLARSRNIPTQVDAHIPVKLKCRSWTCAASSATCSITPWRQAWPCRRKSG